MPPQSHRADVRPRADSGVAPGFGRGADSARRALQERGIKSENDGRGGVVVSDPDGIQIHIA